jgi:hypothetical protein
MMPAWPFRKLWTVASRNASPPFRNFTRATKLALTHSVFSAVKPETLSRHLPTSPISMLKPIEVVY